MPSDLNFDNPKEKEVEPTEQHFRQPQHSKINDNSLNSFTVKGGKALINLEPQYRAGSLIKNSLPTYEIKCYSE